jgi:hypothetical protein
MTSVLNEAYFHDEKAAFGALEAIFWPHGPVCPHCEASDRINRLEGVKDKKGPSTARSVEMLPLSWAIYRSERERFSNLLI